MNKLNKFWLGFVLAIVLVSAAGYRSGDLRNRSPIASAIDADGTVATVTLSQESADCTFVNRDGTSTNTLDLTINGDADAIRLYGGDVYNTNSGDVPLFVRTFATAAVVGTPDIQYFCFGN